MADSCDGQKQSNKSHKEIKLMDSILCNNCGHGNLGYLQFCGNCNYNLITDDVIPTSPPPPVAEISDETLRRNTLFAIVLSCFTTAFKIWFLYSIKQGYNFPSLTDMLFFISPVIVAALVARKSRRWYRVLFADSFLMLLVFIPNLIITIYLAIKK